MTVRSDSQGVIVLEGICPSEDAETLLQMLTTTVTAQIDLRGCEAAHSAVIQVLMAAKPKLLGPPAGSAFREWLYPILHVPLTD
jgi:hypothetical protein